MGYVSPLVFLQVAYDKSFLVEVGCLTFRKLVLQLLPRGLPSRTIERGSVLRCCNVSFNRDVHGAGDRMPPSDIAWRHLVTGGTSPVTLSPLLVHACASNGVARIPRTRYASIPLSRNLRVRTLA